MIQTMTVDVLMTNGEQHPNLQLILADQIAYSEARHRHKWPTMEDDPIWAISFMAFRSMSRQGLFTGSWDDFKNAVAAVTSDQFDDDESF